jgi:hypothetical protein
MTLEQIKEEWVNDEEMAKLLGISVGTLENRVYSGVDHPPYSGKGRGRRWSLTEYNKWLRANMQTQKNRR